MRWLVAILVVLVPMTAVAQPVDEALYSCKPRDTAVEITLKPEIELKELIAWAIGFTCKRFVYEPRIISSGKKVMLMAPGKMSPAEAYQMFLASLSTMGLTVVPKGKLLQIVESASAPRKGVPTYRDKLPPDNEQFARYVMRPSYVQPDTLSKTLGSFKSDAGDVQAVGAFVLITDHASNVRDMASIAKLIDVPGGSEGIYTIPIRHADALKLADKLSSLLGVTATAAPAAGKTAEVAPRDAAPVPSKLVVDERTNTLIVAGSVAAFERVKALVDRLDIALDIEGGTSMHVYQLGSAVADELAKTLNEAIQAQTQGGQGDKKTGGKDTLGSLEGPARVISDKPTNKLIVMSSGRDFIAIREIIRELDVPRRQVYIEAMILEVRIDNGQSFGASAHGGITSSSTGSLLLGGIQPPELKSTNLSSLAKASGLIGGIIGPTLANSTTLFGKSIPSYAVLFQAFADHSRTNILSTMPIIVVDNEEAKYKVGTNVPYKRGVLPTSTATDSPLSTNIDRKPLLLKLHIKPHISTDDSILLEVNQAAEDLGETDSELGPSWTERAIETRVLVRDQQTVVLGGLMQERDDLIQSKVPLLGDIPILGHLFKYTTKSKKKMNLLVMLTPYIVKDHLDLEAIRSRKQREYEEFAGSFRNLDGQPYLPRIDYRRKRGLVEEINRTVQDVEVDTAARDALRKPVYVTPGLVEAAPAPVVAEPVATPTAAAWADRFTPAKFIELPSLTTR